MAKTPSTSLSGSVDAGVVSSGTLDDAVVAETNVTQYEATLNHDNLSLYDADRHRLELRSTGVSRVTPATAGSGAKHLATDTGALSLSNGGSWLPVGILPKLSIVINNEQLQLVNDVDAPGNDVYYGTNGAGTKGYYSFDFSALQPLSEKGNADGYAELDATGRVPVAQLPPGSSGSIPAGLIASRPNPGVEGEWYYSTDIKSLHYRNATEWVLAATTSHALLENVQGTGALHLSTTERNAIPSADQKAALAGYGGTAPSDTNRYATQADAATGRVDALVADSGNLDDLNAAVIGQPFDSVLAGGIFVLEDDGAGLGRIPAGIDGSLLEDLPDQIDQAYTDDYLNNTLDPTSEPTGKLFLSSDAPHLLYRNNGTNLVSVGYSIDGVTIVLNGNSIQVSDGSLGPAKLSGSNPDGTKAYYGDGTWKVPGGGGPAEAVVASVYNETGATLAKGRAVYISGYKTVDDLPTVALAQATSSATMPVYGLVQSDIADGSAGTVVLSGVLEDTGQTTLTQGDGAWAAYDTAGNLNNSRPNGASIVVQKVGVCTRSSGQIDILVLGAGCENSLPNLSQNTRWVGSALGLPVETPVPSAGSGNNAALGEWTWETGTGAPGNSKFRTGGQTLKGSVTEIRIADQPFAPSVSSYAKSLVALAGNGDILLFQDTSDPSADSAHYTIVSTSYTAGVTTFVVTSNVGGIAPVSSSFSDKTYSLQVVKSSLAEGYFASTTGSDTVSSDSTWNPLPGALVNLTLEAGTYDVSWSGEIEHSVDVVGGSLGLHSGLNPDGESVDAGTERGFRSLGVDYPVPVHLQATITISSTSGFGGVRPVCNFPSGITTVRNSNISVIKVRTLT